MSSILDRIVDSKRGEVRQLLSRVSIAELQQQAEEAPPPRDFCGSLRLPGVSLIAEVKKASPSKGVIRPDFNPVEIAEAYAQSGARAISVLTDEPFFQGHLDFLRDVRQAVDVPLLRKDFILDVCQVYEARAAGADAVLLIAECLAPDQLRRLHDLTIELGMTPLVELYEMANLPAVLSCDPLVVGVNNRDLATFEVDLNHSLRARAEIPDEVLFVSESGIFSAADVQLLAAHGVDAMLVGESLMRSADIRLAVSELLAGNG